MQKEQLEQAITQLEAIQMYLWNKRKDHNGNVLQRDDINAMQTTIDILLNLIKEPDYIWKKK